MTKIQTLRPTYIITAVLTLLALFAVTIPARGNLGTVTAGSLSGVTATFGSGSELTLNSSGITLANGAAHFQPAAVGRPRHKR